MSLIQIAPELIHESASDVRRYKLEQEETMNKIRNLVYSLNDSWKGEAQDAFVSRFQSMETTYKGLSLVLEQYAALMDKSADEIKGVDRDMRNFIVNI